MTRDLFLDGKTVLLVEDDLYQVERIEAQLCAIGISDVISATSLKDAHDILDRTHIDLALLDVNLGNSYSTLRLGRELFERRVPVVFCSGFNPDNMAQATRGFEFLEKPLSLPRLKAALQRAILREQSVAPRLAQRKMAGLEARQ